MARIRQDRALLNYALFPVMGQPVVSYALRNRVRWLDPKDGSEIDKASINQPYDIAVVKAGGGRIAIRQLTAGS